MVCRSEVSSLNSTARRSLCNHRMYENLPATMANAAHLYKMGRLEDAAQICAVILQEQNENFEALHLLGVIRWTKGRLQEPLTLQETALAAKPESYGTNTYIV